MITIWMVLTILSLHYLGDFVCQTSWMALNKSHNWSALGGHVLVYMLVISPLGFTYSAAYVIANGLLHFWTDAATSRINAVLADKAKKDPSYWHWFFVSVGADQLIHFACLFLLAGYLQK